tara:strand:+ start:181 stop:735 length:555 start_codon:yes stop_codon:yes gene_type:complete
MRKIFLFVGVVCVAFSSCKKDEIPETIPYEQTLFVIYEPIPPITVSSLIGVNLPFEIPFPDISLDFSSTSENTNPHIGLIRNITLRDFILRITLPQGQTFNFLKDIDVYISTDELSEIPLAHHYNIANSIGSVLHLVSEGGVLDDYLKSESFDLRLELVADYAIFTDLVIDGEWVLDVELINNP